MWFLIPYALRLKLIMWSEQSSWCQKYTTITVQMVITCNRDKRILLFPTNGSSALLVLENCHVTRSLRTASVLKYKSCLVWGSLLSMDLLTTLIMQLRIPDQLTLLLRNCTIAIDMIKKFCHTNIADRNCPTYWLLVMKLKVVNYYLK